MDKLVNTRTFFQRHKARCLKILQFVKQYHQDLGFAPTIREIGAGVDIDSTSHVSWYLDNLLEEDYLILVKGIARTTRVTSKGYRALEVASLQGDNDD